KITHLKYPKLEFFGLQWSNAEDRTSHRNINTLERVLLPVCVSIDSYDGLTYSDRMFNLVPANCVFYLNPFLETSRNAEIYVQIINVQPGDTITINGLTYTATSGA